jgi:hypothetical protein
MSLFSDMSRLRRLLAAVSDEAPAAPGKPPAAPSAGAVDAAADAQQLHDGMAGIRTSLQQTGSALGAVGGVLIAGLGWTRVHDLFPLPAENRPYLLVAAIVAALAATGGSAGLAAQFFLAQRRILVATDHDDLAGESELEPQEQEIQSRIERGHARTEYGETLLDLEMRAFRFERMARNASCDEQKKLKAEAARLNELVSIGGTRVAATILERRAARAFTGSQTLAALSLAILGTAGLFGLADYSRGQRDLIKLRTDCALAVQKVKTDPCAGFLETASRQSTTTTASKANEAAYELGRATAQARTAGNLGTFRRYAACATLVRHSPRFPPDAPQNLEVAASLACAKSP